MAVLGYFITYSTYGTHLHGSESGSVDRHANRPGDPFIAQNQRREQVARNAMKHPTYSLDSTRRKIVFDSVRQHALFRSWELIALHVRSTHVHLVLRGESHPNRMMDEFKAYASRALNRAHLDPPEIKRWTRHGSTRWLDTPRSVDEAVRYTVSEQGEPMELFLVDAWERYYSESTN